MNKRKKIVKAQKVWYNNRLKGRAYDENADKISSSS